MLRVVPATGPLPSHHLLLKMNDDRKVLERSMRMDQAVKPEAINGINWEIAQFAVALAQRPLKDDEEKKTFAHLMDMSFKKPEHVAPLITILSQILEQEVAVLC
jgi:hypothetical protein